MMMVELVDEPGLERLADGVGAAHHVNVLVAGRLAGALDRLLDPRDEREPAALRLLLGPVGQMKTGMPQRFSSAPVPGAAS